MQVKRHGASLYGSTPRAVRMQTTARHECASYEYMSGSLRYVILKVPRSFRDEYWMDHRENGAKREIRIGFLCVARALCSNPSKPFRIRVN